MPGARTIYMSVYEDTDLVFDRVFQGCYPYGGGIGYHKPSETYQGDPWNAYTTDPKTGMRRYYTLYGGKIAGILTQSFCREMFFEMLFNVKTWLDSPGHENVTLIGQFHDEVVLDWRPEPGIDLEHTLDRLANEMRLTRWAGFPLEGDVQHAYRYIK